VCEDIYAFLDNEHVQEKFDLMLLSPPWGGLDYSRGQYDLRTMIACGDGIELAVKAYARCKNIVMLVPRNTSLEQIQEMQSLLGDDCPCLVERIHIYSKLKMVAVYFGAMFQSRKQKTARDRDREQDRKAQVDFASANIE
jgi:hypothetical protein